MLELFNSSSLFLQDERGTLALFSSRFSLSRWERFTSYMLALFSSCILFAKMREVYMLALFSSCILFVKMREVYMLALFSSCIIFVKMREVC